MLVSKKDWSFVLQSMLVLEIPGGFYSLVDWNMLLKSWPTYRQGLTNAMPVLVFRAVQYVGDSFAFLWRLWRISWEFFACSPHLFWVS